MLSRHLPGPAQAEAGFSFLGFLCRDHGLHHSLSWLVGTHDTGDNPFVRVIVLTLLFFVLYGILAPCSTLGPPVDGVAARASVPANND